MLLLGSVVFQAVQKAVMEHTHCTGLGHVHKNNLCEGLEGIALKLQLSHGSGSKTLRRLDLQYGKACKLTAEDSFLPFVGPLRARSHHQLMLKVRG